jgi:hypothetical protein
VSLTNTYINIPVLLTIMLNNRFCSILRSCVICSQKSTDIRHVVRHTVITIFILILLLTTFLSYIYFIMKKFCIILSSIIIEVFFYEEKKRGKSTCFCMCGLAEKKRFMDDALSFIH